MRNLLSRGADPDVVGLGLRSLEVQAKGGNRSVPAQAVQAVAMLWSRMRLRVS